MAYIHSKPFVVFIKRKVGLFKSEVLINKTHIPYPSVHIGHKVAIRTDIGRFVINPS